MTRPAQEIEILAEEVVVVVVVVVVVCAARYLSKQLHPAAWTLLYSTHWSAAVSPEACPPRRFLVKRSNVENLRTDTCLISGLSTCFCRKACERWV